MRGGLGPVAVELTSSTPAVGVLIPSTLSFDSTAQSEVTEFDPLGEGTTDLSVVPPAGFDTPTNRRVVTATVDAPEISMSSAQTVGEDLQVAISVRLLTAPPAPVDLTLSIDDPSVAVLSTSDVLFGGGTVVLPQVAGTTNFTVYLQGVREGATRVVASAPGYVGDETPVTVTPSGFVIQRPSSIDTTTFSTNTNVEVCPARLDPQSLNMGACQELRGGLSVAVEVTSSSPTSGVITNSPLQFSGGIDRVNAVFDPASPGTTDVAVTPPAGFHTPSNRRSITATVDAPDVLVSNVRVGVDLQVSFQLRLEVAPPNPIDVVVTSQAPALAVVSSGPTIAGAGTITFSGVSTVNVGTVVVQGLSVGDTTIVAQAPGYRDGVSQVGVDESGFVFQSPSGATLNTRVGANATSIRVRPARLNRGALTFAETQTVRAGRAAVTVELTNSEAAFGTLSASVLTFDPNVAEQSTTFTPVAAGVTTIAVTPPSGFSTPANRRSVAITVAP